MSESALEAVRLSAGYNGIAAVDGVDLSVAAGEVVSLLGPNGAGKSTTLLALAGLLPAMGGRVSYLGDKVDYKRPFLTARRGLRLVPDDRGLFSSMTVREHLRLTSRKPDPKREIFLLERFPTIAGLRTRKVGLLSGGEQQMLAVVCALLSRPRALMIDEMSLGLAPLIVTKMLPAIRELALDEGIAVLLVEQHVDLALAVSDRAVVLNHGRVVLSGEASELRRNKDDLQAAYFE
ncbi:ABC transporter ATP-binding protein [Rhodococcus sp. P1Y]|uniref:ABC transporter ATP-binding protein n=1 Tax=Rhodococcus sp. P1Y TaxID=1302308 RepID=UPI000EB43C8D|nr:ATP-binding cassette domain-containing protein [Rhodococcus sp. P1Y]AYJ50369.1 ATP-binding cassette domain-containing protein [Rhodococcus sp. P1Y]